MEQETEILEKPKRETNKLQMFILLVSMGILIGGTAYIFMTGSLLNPLDAMTGATTMSIDEITNFTSGKLVSLFAVLGLAVYAILTFGFKKKGI